MRSDAPLSIKLFLNWWTWSMLFLLNGSKSDELTYFLAGSWSCPLSCSQHSDHFGCQDSAWQLESLSSWFLWQELNW
ncbi:hypothetical protein AKJ16_DCAP06142 [Drosera capensis]